MIIDNQFLIDNNITQEEYIQYYNSITLQDLQKEVNEYGKVTLTMGNIGFEFYKGGDIKEEEIIERLQDDYRTSITITHFIELTENRKEEMKKNQLSPEEEWRNEVQVTLEYIACMNELNQ